MRDTHEEEAWKAVAEYLRREAERKQDLAESLFLFGAMQLVVALLHFYLAVRVP